YATLENVLTRSKRIWERRGFALTFSEGTSDKPNMIRTVCVRSHKEGHSESYWLDLPPDGIGAKGNAIGGMNPVQGCVSSGSYAQRVLTTRIWDMANVGE